MWRTWLRVLSLHNVNEQACVIDEDETRFLELCSGRGADAFEAPAYILHLKTLTEGRWNSSWDSLISTNYRIAQTPSTKIRQLLHEVADVLREHGGVSINRMAQKLQGKNVLRGGDDDEDLIHDLSAHSL